MNTHLHSKVASGRFSGSVPRAPRPSPHTRQPSGALVRPDSFERLADVRPTTAVRATPHAAEASQIIDAVVQQRTPHDSLLKDGSSFFWDFMDSVANGDNESWLRSVAHGVSSIPDVPFAVKDAVTKFTSQLASYTASTIASSPVSLPAAGSLASVQSAADSVWQSLLSAGLLANISRGDAVQNISDYVSGALAGAPPHPALLSSGSLTPGQQGALAAAAIAAAAVSAVQADVRAARDGVTASDAELPTEYDQEAIYRYWSTRPVMLFKRSMQTTVLAVGFLVGLSLDKKMGTEKVNEAKRARALRVAIDQLGPAYIKVAQALSTRVDILSPAYFEEITFLQDRVQPFDNDEAMAILAAELGQPVSAVFSDISAAPVAAASLGQVYKAKLRSDGSDVAVKVQRPGVLELVALDLVLMRKGIEISNRFFPDMTRAADILPVLDEWALKFFREMDYRKEAGMMQRFKADLAPLDGILVPEAYLNFTTRRVLCTQWIAGEKLSESRAEDVRELCTTLLNAFLIQLLDTGLLHADPHPGNLIRTPDGKICILDYGLVTEVPTNLRVALLEYMAHLSMKDWRALGDDFVALQFVTEDSLNPNEIPGLMDSVGALMEVLMAGGGAVNIDPTKTRELVDMVGLDPADLEDGGFMEGFASVLDNLANPSAVEGADSKSKERAQKIKLLNEKVKFRLPPYFVLILRAFSVIEGIALKVDPKYSIINETFPYLSRRLLTDDNEEVRRALKQVLYGRSGRMDLSRMQTLFSSLQSFTTDGLTKAPAAAGRLPGSTQDAAASTSESALDKNTLLALQSVLNTSGSSYLQQLLVAELAATLESLSRGAAVSLLQASLQSSVTNSTLRTMERLGPLRNVLFPFPLPAEIIARLGSVVTLTEDDRIAISNVQTLWQLLRPQLSADVGDRNVQLALLRSFSAAVAELPAGTRAELVQGAGRTSQMVLQEVVQRTATRFSADVASLRQQQQQVDAVLGAPAAAPAPALATAFRREE